VLVLVLELGRARVWFGGRSDPAIIVQLPSLPVPVSLSQSPSPSLPVPVSQSLQPPKPKAGTGAGDPIICSYTGCLRSSQSLSLNHGPAMLSTRRGASLRSRQVQSEGPVCKRQVRSLSPRNRIGRCLCFCTVMLQVPETLGQCRAQDLCGTSKDWNAIPVVLGILRVAITYM
jgi:hypothetical protein